MRGDIGVIMEAAIVSTLRSRYLSQNLPNNAVHLGTLSEQFNVEMPVSVKHHTFPRASVSKRVKICENESAKYASQSIYNFGIVAAGETGKPEENKHLGCFSREVSDAWQRHVGAPEDPAPADRVQSLFNDIELYPTKTQVFEMLVCARQCARRKSLTLTFGEFCVFAAELRKCSNQIRQVPKVESPQWNVDKDTVCKPKNGSELTPPPCEVFLGGSCNPTTWRSDIAIPILKKMGITYFNPQVDVWSSELIEVEYKAKAAARALLFVLDSETRTVATCVEAAQLATEPRDLLLVLRPYTRHQKIGRETISDMEYMELSRARATLQEVVERRGLPAFSDIPSALRCARAVLRGARTHPRHPLGQSIVRLKRAFDASGGRSGQLPTAQALQALQQVSQAPLHQLTRSLPKDRDSVDFETFCAVVAEVAVNSGCEARVPCGDRNVGVAKRLRRAFVSFCHRLVTPSDAESPCKNGSGVGSTVDRTLVNRDNERVEEASTKDIKVHQYYNPRLRSYGKKLKLDIPKNGGVQSEDTSSGSIGSSDSVFTPGTERRLERLPAMLGVPSHDVYLGGMFPSKNPRPEEYLIREGITYIIPRMNDYTRMFSAGARRSASSQPESPHADKRLRPDEDVELRVKKGEAEPADRLSASDFYSVSEDVTPQPFKGTYDEDLLFGSKVLLFSVNAESPCFATMVLAAHYMGLRPNATVLMVQTMDPDSSHPYSETAVKDYNRGRHYLKDLARRSNVSVYDNMEDAMRAVISRIKNPKPS